jgi:hypothetical protein
MSITQEVAAEWVGHESLDLKAEFFGAGADEDPDGK